MLNCEQGLKVMARSIKGLAVPKTAPRGRG